MVRTLSRRIQAVAGLVVFTIGLALPYAAAGHLAFDDDAACGGASIAGAGTHPEFAAPEPARAASHCAICHWLRTASGAQATLAAGGDTWFQPVELVQVPASQWASGADVVHRPSRAPPVRF